MKTKGRINMINKFKAENSKPETPIDYVENAIKEYIDGKTKSSELA